MVSTNIETLKLTVQAVHMQITVIHTMLVCKLDDRRDLHPTSIFINGLVCVLSVCLERGRVGGGFQESGTPIGEDTHTHTHTHTHSLVPRPRPAFHHLQYGKAGEGLVYFLT